MPRIAHWPAALLSAAALIPGCHPLGEASLPRPAPRFVPAEIAFWTLERGISLDRHGAVALTVDGGRQWRIVGRWGAGRDGYAPHSLSVSGTTSVAFLRGCSRGGCREIVRSGNGGRSWSTTTASIRPVTMVLARTDPHVAWALVSRRLGPVRLVRSIDGGLTWQRVPTPCRDGEPFFSTISLATPRTGWEMCSSQPGAGEQPKRLLETTDGGRTFRRLLDLDPFDKGGRAGGLWISGYTVALSITAGGFGLLAQERADSVRTADGGRDWYAIRHVTQPDYRDAFAAFQLSPRAGFMLVYGGGRTDLYRSTDGDRHWTRVHRWAGP